MASCRPLVDKLKVAFCVNTLPRHRRAIESLLRHSRHRHTRHDSTIEVPQPRSRRWRHSSFLRIAASYHAAGRVPGELMKRSVAAVKNKLRFHQSHEVGNVNGRSGADKYRPHRERRSGIAGPVTIGLNSELAIRGRCVMWSRAAARAFMVELKIAALSEAEDARWSLTITIPMVSKP